MALSGVVAVIGIALAFSLLHLGHRRGRGWGIIFRSVIRRWSIAGLYNDLVLAAIAQDWWGRPSLDVKYVYWFYFAAQEDADGGPIVLRD
jgi:hypothetical protein